jgi:glycoside/pentoside/hexuronide:cation symporter, GPH family
MNESRLTLREQLAYGCGDFASCLFWQTFMKYLPFYYTEVYGLSAAALGGLLLFSRIFDGVNDPLVGMWADRTNTRFGKFRPFILFGAIPFAIFGVLTFTTPSLPETGKLVWAYVTYNGLMVMYTVVNIPYTAMLGVLTRDPTERTRLSSIKFMFAFSAGMVISATLLPMVRFFGPGDAGPQRGWQLTFVVVGLVAVAFFWLTVWGTRERVQASDESGVSVLGDLKILATNRPWLILLATTLAYILYIATRSSVFAHYFKYAVYGGDTSALRSLFGIPMTFDTLVSTFNTVGQGLSVLGVFVTAALAGKVGKRPLFFLCFSLAIVATAAYFVIPPTEVTWLFVADALGTAVSSPLNVLLWAMYADTADFGEWKTGRRTTGLVFSASTMGQKVGWAVAGYAAFQLLSSVGFKANLIPTAEVQSSLTVLMSLVPALMGILSMVIFAFYPLGDAQVVKIATDLQLRRRATENGDATDWAGGPCKRADS